MTNQPRKQLTGVEVYAAIKNRGNKNMDETAIIQLLGEVIEQLTALRADVAQVQQDVRTILQHTPMQMIPADPGSEVQ